MIPVDQFIICRHIPKKAEEIFLYTMQKGELSKFDEIIQLNETKEKHRKHDKNKQSDMQCTKNLLRNLNQTMLRFLLRSKIAEEKLQMHFGDKQEEIQKFKKWATLQKMDNFQQCRNLWTFDRDHDKFEYLELFREIQFQFFSDSSCPAIFSSKVRDSESKKTHLKYIHTFLQGIVNPQLFTCFKKSGKLKEQEKQYPLQARSPGLQKEDGDDEGDEGDDDEDEEEEDGDNQQEEGQKQKEEEDGEEEEEEEEIVHQEIKDQIIDQEKIMTIELNKKIHQNNKMNPQFRNKI